ncbi:MAG TPA: symmetrical bis(5'-nucleosyl)-tetraphosphatase [Candidatus Tectomicrobia bacterium]
MAVYAIGDVQGCYTALLALLDRLHFDDTRDQLWFAGDLVNRGPQSLEVLRFAKALGEGAITVLGNHDLHLLAVAHGRRRLKKQDTLADVLAAPDRDDLLTWLRHRPLLHHDATCGITLLHAGMAPQWTLAMAQTYATEVEAVLRGPEYLHFLDHLDSQAQSQGGVASGKWERLRYTTHCLTRLRFCDTAGRLNDEATGPPGSQPPPFLPWFAIPQRASADLTLVFGHWSSLGLYQAPGIYALDTGCVWGGALTALCLETREHVSVPCGTV